MYKEASPQDIAEALYVSERTVRRNVAQFLLTGDVASRPIIGRPRFLNSQEETVILDAVFENLGICLDKIQRHLEEIAGVVISIPTICRTVQWLGLTRRKIRHIVLSRSDAQRAAFCVQIEDVDASYFMWLDEAGVDHQDGIRRIEYSLRGHAPVSQKLMGCEKGFQPWLVCQ